MLEIGSLIDGKYKILNEVGHGGMSVVYLAMNERANKQWAIKEVRKDGVKDFEVVKQSLVAETNMLKKLSHPRQYISVLASVCPIPPNCSGAAYPIVPRHVVSSMLFSLYSLAVPKSISTTFPSGFSIMFAGFISRYMIAGFCECRYPRTSHSCLAHFITFFCDWAPYSCNAVLREFPSI